MALIAANAVNRQLVMTLVADALIIGPAQHFNHIAHPKTLSNAIDAGKRLLRLDQTIVAFWRVQTDIAVVARLLATFAKIVKQHQTTAGLRFGKRAHGVEFMSLNVL